LGAILKQHRQTQMGLDITHYKATLKRPEKLNPFSHDFVIEEEFEGFDTNFHHFDSSIQMIDTPTTLKTLIFPKIESEIDEVKDSLNCDEYIYLYEQNAQDIDKSVGQYLQTNSLTNHLLHSWTTNKWFGFHIYKLDKQVGFYFEEVGYQRKGVNDKFWTRFGLENINCFTKRDDFEFALTCVDYYWHDDTKDGVNLRRQLFKENFVDKYETNKSWIRI
jgi:hypothetical protein